MQPLELTHKERIETLFAQHPPFSCEMTFASLFAWRTSRMMQVVSVGDSAVLLTKKDRGLCVFGPPLGAIGIAEAIDRVHKETGMPVLACERVTEAAAGDLGASHAEVFEDRNYFDYVYRRHNLAELKGRDYHAKRNLIAQCLSEHDCVYEPFSAALLPEIRDMQDRWCATRDCGKTPGLCHEYRAIQELFDHASDLDLDGCAIRIGGKIEAYTLGSRLNDRTFAIHFEKAMPQYKGLYQVINQWFCREALGGYEFVNREQDVGSPGLRQAKESYLPDHMIKKLVALRGISRDEYAAFKTEESHCE